jgi:hypothetical protein
MSVQVDTDMERGFAQLYEIQKRLLNGSLSPVVARRPLQDIIEGKFPADSRFDRYSGYLLSLEEQFARLRDFNQRFWDGRLSDELLDAASDLVSVPGGYTQCVDDLHILYVDFGSPKENVELWWKVITGTQPNAWRWDELKTDKKHLRLAKNVHQYKSGIYRIRINLVAHWEPKDGRTIIQVRKQAAAGNETLAHAEVLAAYGLHDQLLQQQDGTNLPYADVPGFEVNIPGGRPWADCPYLRWSEVARGVDFSAYGVGHVYDDWSAPVLRES